MSIKKDILWRVAIVYVGFLLFGLIIIGKILYIQNFEKEIWKNKKNTSLVKNLVIPSNRGNIYTEDGRLLATSIPYYEVRMDLKTSSLTDRIFYKEVDSLAISLYNLFRFESSKSKNQYKKELIAARKRGDRYFLLNPKINYIQLQQLKKFPILRRGKYKGGLIVIQKDTRVRPHENLAARFIGYTSNNEIDNVVGIEGAYNEHLSGVNGLALMHKIPGSVWMPVNDDYEIDPKNGMDVITTIDLDYQDVAERALFKQLISQDAEHGCAILMEVKTGDVKAIVNLGKDKNGIYREIQNYAIYESVEPGSTFKLPVLIAALEDGFIELEDSVNTGNGIYQYTHDKIIKDDNYWKGGSGWITVQRAFEVSSNIAMVKIISEAYKGRESHFIDRLVSMRINEKLGMEIKGEGQPYIKYPNDKLWSGISLGMMSHGYEVKMTPFQLLAFYNAVANDGKMVKPRFVKEIRQHGRTIKSVHTDVLKFSICSNSTLKKAKKLLEGVVENGTAQNIKNKNFKIAGKTGTSQLFDSESRTYRSDKGTSYQASFVGYFPADDPKYSCIVVVNSPSKDIYHGNEVAAPVFFEIANKVYSLDFEENYVKVTKPEKLDLPYSKGGNANEFKKVTHELNIDTKSHKLKTQWVNANKKDDYIEISDKTIIKNLVPNVVSMGAKDAVFLLENAGLKVIVKGRGSVKNQSIPAGSRVKKGETIILEMSFV